MIYDRTGNVRAIGAETTNKEINKIAENRQWITVKWYSSFAMVLGQVTQEFIDIIHR
jgi:hypothetical protein